MQGNLYVGTESGLAIYCDDGQLHLIRTVFEGHWVQAIAAPLADAPLITLADLPPQQSFDAGEDWIPAAAGPDPWPPLAVATLTGPATLVNPRLMGATAYARLGKLLIGAGAGGTMFFRSHDDGIHWEPAAGGAPSPVRALIPSAHRRTSAYAGCADGSLLRSDDDGASWHVAAHAPAAVTCMIAVAG